MKYKHIPFSFILSVCFLFYSCNANTRNRETNVQNDIQQNIQAVPSVKIERLDIDIYHYLKNPTPEKELDLNQKYGNLLEAFGSSVLNNSNTESKEFYPKLQQYFSNDALFQIYINEQNKFADISTYQEELDSINQRIYQLFDSKTLPTLNFHVSGFKENIIATDRVISISADKYLGSDYPAYQLYFEQYQLSQMQPEFIPRDLVKAFIINELPKSKERKTLLSEMIAQGKILFALEELLPEWKESDLIGYTQDQVDWCSKNEKLMWNKTISNQYLFTTDFLTINKYIEEAPYTSIISSDAPGYVGRWIGLQIIREYAKNTGESLSEILNQKNEQLILKLSKYNPK